jgi:hypothetical protein
MNCECRHGEDRTRPRPAATAQQHRWIKYTPTFSAACDTDNPSLITANTA